MRRYVLAAAACVAAANMCVSTADADQNRPDPAADFPHRTVRIIVSSAPAGGPDIVARILADKLQPRWGQPVIVENRAGASGNLGAEVVAAAEPDGHTLLAAQPSPLVTNAMLYKKLNFNPEAFAPVAIMSAMPNTLVVRQDFPARTVRELIAYAKANPGRITYGSQGIGTTPHLTAELFSRLTGASMTHVPYRGTAQAVNDLVAGHLDMLFMQLDAVREHVTGGKIRMLAMASRDRIDAFPNVPTLKEAGVDGLVSDTWNALAAPPGTPPTVVGKINAAVNEIFALPDVKERFATLSLRPIGGTPEEMTAFLAAERARWGDVVRSARMTAD